MCPRKITALLAQVIRKGSRPQKLLYRAIYTGCLCGSSFGKNLFLYT
jgi:hypothetical protein